MEIEDNKDDKFEQLLDAKGINRRLTYIEDAIKRIELALIGNPSLGHKGIVERINDLEVQVNHHDKKLLTWGGVITGIIITLQIIISQITKLF
jgi:hypothetical protein